MLELWGLGDLVLALPFLRAASASYRVTLLAKPHTAPLLARFAPAVEHLPLNAPWTAFTGKYRLHRWPWRVLLQTRSALRTRHFDLALSARPDPRDHLLLALSGARQQLGFPRKGSGLFLTQPLALPASPHRAAHWQTLAAALDLTPASTSTTPSSPTTPPASASAPRGRRIVIHAGAGHPVRMWPRERFDALATQLRAQQWEIHFLDTDDADLDGLARQLASADYFIGNDSGPGHFAAFLGIPTFTIFGPQLPELFAPQHPQAAWIEGSPCPHKPCFDKCRFAEPFCIRDISVESVWSRVVPWLK